MNVNERLAGGTERERIVIIGGSHCIRRELLEVHCTLMHHCLKLEGLCDGLGHCKVCVRARARACVCGRVYEYIRVWVCVWGHARSLVCVCVQCAAYACVCITCKLGGGWVVVRN